MNAKSAYYKICILVLLAGLLTFPMTVRAEDGDPDGTRLKALLDQPDVPKDVKESLNSNTVNYDLICSFEDLTIPGRMIWYYRLGKDHCDNKKTWNDNAATYCIYYSERCNHFQWTPDCLSTKKACPE